MYVPYIADLLFYVVPLSVLRTDVPFVVSSVFASIIQFHNRLTFPLIAKRYDHCTKSSKSDSR